MVMPHPAIRRRHTDPGVAILVAPHPRTGAWGEWRMPLQLEDGNGAYYPTGVAVDNAGAFPPKQVIGDYREGDHEALSFLTQNTWIGGGQQHEAEEAQGIDRYTEIATLDTRFPFLLCLLPLTVEVEGEGSGDIRVLGDMVVGTPGVKTTFVAQGLDIRTLNGAFPSYSLSTAVDTLDALPHPYAQAVLYRVAGDTKMYIPQGSGYQVFDGATLGSQITTVKAEHMVVFSRKLWAVDGKGVLWKSLDGTNWVQVDQLDPGYEVRDLTSYLNRYEAPAPYIHTDQMAFIFDESVPAIYPTELNQAPHRYAQVANEVWRTDMYSAIGMGVMRYTLGTVDPVGLDRNTGCGRLFTGAITSLCKSWNDLIAGVSSTSASGVELEESRPDQGWEMYAGASTGFCHVQRLNSTRNWHTMWKAPLPGGAITDITVSTARSEYVAMWGWQGKLCVHQLPQDFDNPEVNPSQYFMPDGELVSSWFDMNMKASRKTGAAWEARAGSVIDAQNRDLGDLGVENYTRIDYQIDSDDVAGTWRPLPRGGLLSVPGEINVFMLGEDGLFPQRTGESEQKAVYYGQGFDRIRYRISMRRDPSDTRLSPTMKSILLDFYKTGRSIRSFGFTVNCSNPDFDKGWGLSNDDRREMLKDLMRRDGFFPCLISDRWYMVKPAYANGPEMTGTDTRGDVMFSAIEAFDQDQIRG